MSTRLCLLTQPLIQSIDNTEDMSSGSSMFKAIRAVKLLQYVIANLNLKGFSFFYTHCMYFCAGKHADIDPL